jgi:tetratricopeptide (TPR) repeat protein
MFLAFGAAVGDEFVRGNEAYASGKYADAVKHFESAASQGEYSPALFFNLGNSYYRDNKLGHAVLNYERALWLKPTDPDARANLRFARQTAGLYPPTQAWWEVVASWGSLNQWAWSAAISLVWVCAALVTLLLVPAASWRWALKPVIAIGIINLVLSYAGMAVRMADSERGVVLTQDAPLRVAPLEKSPAANTLRAGDVVQIENRRPAFYYVTAQDGRTGWLSDRDVAPVIPGS